MVAQQCELAGLQEEHYQIQPGKDLAKAYVVTFVGEPRLAARRAAMLLGTMRDAEGAWRQPHAVTPAGESVRVWLDPDKNGKQVKGEAALRRLLRAFRSVAPADKRVFMDTGALAITSNWRPLARVVMGEPNEEPRVEWNIVALNVFGVARTVIEAEVQRIAGSRTDPVEWCS